MRYENYQKRITKIADVLRVILHRWPLFLLQLIIVVAAISAFVFFKGTVISVHCASTVFYGDALECKSIALFSETHLEYRTSSGEWTKEPPVMPGEYQLRVVGKGFFGEKTSDTFDFTIEKRMIAVHSLNGTVDYGEKPILSADLAYNDVLYCEEFETEDIFVKNGTELYLPAKPEKSAILIKNADGKDVTAAYDIRVEKEELRIIPREITVTVEDASKIYDGTAFSFDGYELSQGTLANGDSLFAYFTRSIVNAGSVENTPSIVLISKNGIDVTPCYNLTIVKGMLTVEKRPLIIKTASGEFEYDGTSHTLKDYEISKDTPLVQGQSLSATWGKTTDVGEYKNIPSIVTVTTESSVDVTNNYSIFFEAGTLKIDPLPITISTADGSLIYQGAEHKFSFFGFQIEQGNILEGHYISHSNSSTASNAGKYVNDTEVTINDLISGREVTHNYNITYIRGTIEIKKLPLTIETSSAEWTYNGLSHYSEKIASGSLGYNDKILITERTTVTDVGTYPNKLSVKIIKESNEHTESAGNAETPDTNENYIDVTNNYDISFVYGTLTVNKRFVILKPVDANKIYDANPLTSSTLQVSPKSENNLASGHTVFSAQTSGNLTDVGTLTNYIIPSTVLIHDANGNDVTRNYEIGFSVGLLTVSPREILVQTGSAVKEYDGTALTNKTFSVEKRGDKELIDGHVINVENIGSLSRVGKAENICSLDKTRIYDADGKDVTSNYLVSYSYGMLEVYDDTNNELYNGSFNESGKIGSFRSELTPSKDDDIAVILPSLLSVKDDRNGYIYLRLKSFGGYAGSEWYEATEYPELLLGQYSATYLTSFALGQSTHTLNATVKNPLSFMPYYASVYSSTPGILGTMQQTSDVFYNMTTASGGESYYTVLYKDYDYSSSLVLPEEYAEYEEAYRAFVHSQYLVLDDETRAYMDNIIEKEKFFDKDIKTILSVAKYIQNSAKYNVNYDETLDESANVAIAFLEKYGEGTSQHFASALTLLYRAMGIPARYTIGYATATLKDEWVEVDRSKVHAWVEVYIDGVGWIEIEATGGNSFGLNGSGGRPQKQEITVKPIYRCKLFDNKALKASSILEYDPLLAELASMGYFWSVKVSGSIDTVGRTESIPTEFILYDPYGNNVTNQYNIVLENGILEIFDSTTIVIKIGLSSLQKHYDGTPLSFGESDYNISTTASLTGVNISVNISLIDAGYLTLSELNENAEKYVSIKYDPKTSNIHSDQKVVVMFTEYSSSVMSIAMVEPILKIDPRPITVVASSASKIFDGTPLTSGTAYLSKGSLCSGHTMKVTVRGSIDYLGTEANKIARVVITNELGEDVTDNYDITTVDGTLIVYETTYGKG